jgi:glucoside 3-dehydrogenase (cytochrome c) hitch-hiker subunit
MTEPGQDFTLHRRALLERAIFLVGGAAALSLGACAKPESGAAFDAAQMADLDIITDIMIPATDTPGARGAGVPAFMENMMVNWASAETRAKYAGVLKAIGDRARADHGAPLARLDADKQLAAVRAYDADNIGAESDDYRHFKELALLGYYNSEIGATQELRYELVPGVWRADIPFSDIGRAWAA